jgi:hypothetical protein
MGGSRVNAAQQVAKRLRRPVLVDDGISICELDEYTTLGTCRDDDDAVYIIVRVIARGVPAQDKARIRQALSTALYRSAYLFSHQLRGE